MVSEIQNLITKSLLKFQGLEIDQEVMTSITLEVNAIVSRLSPSFRASFYIEPYYLKSEKRLKFNIQKIH